MEKERIVWLDVVRTFAISAVVLCHAVEQVYDMSLIGWQNLSVTSKIFRALGFTLGRIGVPLFLLLTGFLVLGKIIDTDEGCMKFYKINLLPLFLCTEIWIVLYNLYNGFVVGGTFDINRLLRNMFFLEGTQMTNMWYMPMILGIYLVIPFLSVIFQHFSFRVLIWLIMVSVVANFIVPSANVVSNLFHGMSYDIVLNVMFLGGWYGLYIFVGHFLYKSKNRLHEVKSLICFLLSFLATSFFQFLVLEVGYEYNLWYNFIGLLLTAIFLFELLRGFEKSTYYKLFAPTFSYVSKISLGIFFLHKPALIFVEPLIVRYGLPQPVKAMVLFSLSFCFCLIAVRILSKVGFIRKYCFLIK